LKKITTYLALPNFEVLSKLVNHEDGQFLAQLTEVYQLIGSKEKAEKIQNIIDSLKKIKYEPLTMLKR
jgi:hypothetical protein